MSRLTQTSNLGGVAFTFDLDVTCTQSEMKKILKIAEKLKEYEDAEEQGLLPKFHLGDEFWTVRFSGVTKEKIVMLQQKKDGTWKYRFPNTCDYEESDYGKYFFDTKEEAETFWEERYGIGK